ncbi:MAG: NAD(P)/FAD-dependent oxidoreductase [Deltaproteobacteria bacterium]
MTKNSWDAAVDIVIIGAGVIGLAIAGELSAAYPRLDIILVEKNENYGQETSSRSSEVIHAGIYYPETSLKGKLCRQGNQLLYRYCELNRVGHRRCGKVIIAVDQDELHHLQEVFAQGQANGVRLEWLTSSELQKRIPEVNAIAGIWSPDTGIVDSRGLMYSYYYRAREQGVTVMLKAPVLAIQKLDQDYLVTLPGETIKSRMVVNAAGLYSDQIAAMPGLDIDECGYRLHYCRGEYYRLRPRRSIDHLVYPLPERAGLGIHLTLDLNGGQRLGPDFCYVDKIDYKMDDSALEAFYQSARRYLPWLERDDLIPDYCGIRPKLQAPGEDFRDFIIKEESDRGYRGLISLIGLESPGLTSSLAVGQYVTQLVKQFIRLGE